MPMPKMPELLDTNHIDGITKSLVIQHGQACYSEGKADERAALINADGRFPAIHLIDLEDGEGVKEFVAREDAERWGVVCAQSAAKAYSRGELEEVK